MTTYDEALAKQRGVMSSKQIIEASKNRKRKLLGIRCYVKREIPAGCVVYLALTKTGYEPCAHITLGNEAGDLLMAQIALIGPSALPKMEGANDH